ncbi:VWA domain-containing protein [Aquincola tertiaricarbonis]|uniref:VWA domain-containing protein n=2 Tax=Aquincola tertiaricarbonis TaxID=391953 RepID=A0ABY4SD67_AQUTE|nr:VWA domain-containing protein [Aquincola tertiaricarbonis]URI11266.1 VWA domain-containing protein [Aquincola tertiaricarbonis]
MNGFNFLWPDLLWLLLAVPLLVLLYLWLLRRRKRTAVAWASLGIVKEAMGRGTAWRRHVPPLLFLAALVSLLLATARPAAVITLPLVEQTIILAMDVSGSMRAADVEPNRLVAAQNAAKSFITELPRQVRVGVVSFAGTAAVVQPPTTSREDVVAAIDRFQLQRGTAIGSGIVLSLATIFPDANIDLSQVTGQRPMPGALDEKKPDTAAPVEPGSYNSAAVILLTDGQRTTGPDSIDAARMAADRGVKVYTVGIGTKEGETIGFEGWSMRVRLDEETLKNVASATRAEYFYAGTAEDLKKVYQSLGSRLTAQKKETEITALFAGLGAALAVAAAALSLLWFNRVL